MYWILFVMGALVSVVVAIVVGGLATPRSHVAARSITVRATPDTVWPIVRDVGSYATWRPEVQSTRVEGEEWQEFTTSRTIRYGVAGEQAPHSFVARILDDDLPFTGEWQWTLEPQNGGTRITLTERGEVGNPLFRFFSAHVTGYTRTIDEVLNALAIRVGDAAAPIHDAGPGTGPA